MERIHIKEFIIPIHSMIILLKLCRACGYTKYICLNQPQWKTFLFANHKYKVNIKSGEGIYWRCVKIGLFFIYYRIRRHLADSNWVHPFIVSLDLFQSK